MIRSYLVGVALLASAVTVVAQQDPIATRRALMKANGEHSAALARMVRGEAPYDQSKVEAAFSQWSETATKLPTLFPEGSQTGDTRALVAIWQNRADFDARSAKFAKDVSDNKSKVTDVESLKAVMPAIGPNCGGCHEKYRRLQN
jgi:cytochrome c556